MATSITVSHVALCWLDFGTNGFFYFREYVEEVFNNCLPDKRDQAEKQLRAIIMEKHKQGTLMTADWKNMDLPL